jgi:F-type H+-transporting ATPase subunit b
MATFRAKDCLLAFVLTGMFVLLSWPCSASESSKGESTWSIVFKFINVAIFVAIVYKLGAKKIGDFFKDRRQKAKDAIERALKKEEEASRLLGEWKDKIARAEEEARKIIDASVSEGKRLRDKILQEAGEEAQIIIEQAKVAAAEEMKKTRGILGKELAALSAAKAEALLKEKIDSERQKRLVDEFLRELEELS